MRAATYQLRSILHPNLLSCNRRQRSGALLGSDAFGLNEEARTSLFPADWDGGIADGNRGAGVVVQKHARMNGLEVRLAACRAWPACWRRHGPRGGSFV